MKKNVKKMACALLLPVALTCLLTACKKKDPCAKGHTWVYDHTTPATCTSDAYEDSICSVCGNHSGHFVQNTKKPHEFVEGVCKACGYVDAPVTVREGALLFSLNEQGKAYSVRVDGVALEGRVEIPATIYDLPVTVVEENGFKDQTEMTEIVLPQYLLKIEKSAFEGCTGMTSIIANKDLTTVQDRAFYGCASLTEVYFGEDLTKIGAAAFGGCGRLQKMVLPFVGGLSYIDYRSDAAYTLGYIFGTKNYDGAQKVTMRHKALTNNGLIYKNTTYYIPASLACVEITVGNWWYTSDEKTFHIIDGAFDGCGMLRELVLAPKIQTANAFALRGLTGLERLIAPGLQTGVSEEMPSLIELDNAWGFDPVKMPNVTNLTIREVRSAEDVACLADYDKLTDLTIAFADDVKKVKAEDIALISDRLTGIMLPSATTMVEQGLLSLITTPKRAALPYSMLAELDMQYLEELTVLSDSDYTISDTLFASATKLKALTLDSHVTGFAERAFEHCTLLDRVTLDGKGESLTYEQLVARWLTLTFGGVRSNPLTHGAELYFEAKDGARPVGEVTLPSDVTALGAYCFDGCSNLTALSFGTALTAIGQDAFANTTALLAVRFDGTLAAWCAIRFANGGANPANGADALYVGGKKLTELDGTLALTEIPANAFYGYRALTKVTLGEGTMKIGACAFGGCVGLTEVSLPATLTRIDACAFEGCEALFSVGFADPSGWYGFENEAALNGMPISSADLGDAVEASSCLVTLYPDYTFKKVN